MPSRTVHLTERHEEFVTREVETGRYGDASEVLRAGLRLLEVETAKKESWDLFEALVKEGFDELDQGLGIELDSGQELEDFIRGIGRTVANRVNKDSATQ